LHGVDINKAVSYLEIPSGTSIALPKKSASSVFGGLSRDTWDDVLAYLFPPDLVSMAQLNSTFHKVVTASVPWKFFQTLFPTSRKIWSLSWQEAYEGYVSRTVPPTGNELVKYNLTDENLPQDQSFGSLFLNTNRRVIEFFGPSVRHRHDTFLTQTNPLAQTCQSWRITSTEQYSMGQVVSIHKTELNLPPRGHHLRPAGLDVVGTFLFWVDYADSPLDFTISPNGIDFGDEIGENVLWPDGVFDETSAELSLLQTLFVSWGESQFEFTGQMVWAGTGFWDRKRILRLYDYETSQVTTIPFDKILGQEGPWLGKWSSPWILPWGFDDDGNLLFKILDTRIVNGMEHARCVQTSLNLTSMRTTFSIEILEDIQLLSPWNFQMFSDQCWGYPVKDANGDIWCILRDLRDGNIVKRLGPLNYPSTKPTDYSCHISMFHVIFQDKSMRFGSKSAPAYTPLRVFPIKSVPPSIQNTFSLPTVNARSNHCQLLYELTPPEYPEEPPGFWTFGGEDAAERYLFFQGSTINIDDTPLHDDWRKWVIWDSLQREWSVLQCQREWGSDGFYCLFSEIVRGKELVGLDWIRMEL
jgi:hypothetical protein